MNSCPISMIVNVNNLLDKLDWLVMSDHELEHAAVILLRVKEKERRSSIVCRSKEKKNYRLIYERERRKTQFRLLKPELNAEYQCRALLLAMGHARPMGAGETGGGRRGQWGP